MPTYKYKAISLDGAPVSGVMEAYDEYAAVDRIKETCAVVTRISEVRHANEAKELFGPPKIKHKVLAMIASQFSIILTAGLPIVRAVELIAGQTSDRYMRRILQEVAADVAAGHSLAQSFENKGGVQLPSTFIETVRAGEESGTLDKAFAKLHTYYDKSAKIKAKVISAMAYPIFLCIVAVIVVMIIMVKAVPVFVGLFDGMGTTLPLPTRILIATSNFLTKYILFLLLGMAILIIACKLWQRTEDGKRFFARMSLKLPVLGRVNIMKGASQFANTMATMLSAGLPMVKAVTATGKAMDNYVMGMETLQTVSGIEQGKRLGACMKNGVFFPPLLVEMTSVGEETGSMEATLDVIGEYFDTEVEQQSARALSLLEPSIIIVLAVFVVFILLAVYLPLFSLYGSIG
ncbi:MAG: type II secretion system F family protein [Clostridia bacterium]|nr:type II secretion system F family protein [Clostridia bacterium]